MMKMLVCQVLLLLMMSLTSSSEDSKNLDCYSDYIDVITCVWNTSSVEDRFNIMPTTNCFLQGEYNDYISIQKTQRKLEALGSSQTKLRKGTLNFINESFTMGYLYAFLYVRCENMTEPVEAIQFYPRDHIRLYPPKRPLVEGANVTWQPGSPQCTVVNLVKYEVQWGLLEDSWGNNQVASTDEKHCELPEEKLIVGKQYVVRVRSTPANQPKLWSEWSPVTQWKATVGLSPQPGYMMPDIFMNLSSVVILAATAVLIVACVCIVRILRKRYLYVPTPGKYFGDLFSGHGGDFKSWLGPIMNPEMDIKADLESISHVTICKACNSEILSDKMEKDVNIKNGNNSSFSNSTYFLSQSSKCAIVDQLEPCLADCPYGPAGGDSVQEKFLPATHDNGRDHELSEVNMSTPLETSSSYKQLQKLRLDIQSPDSGFAGSSGEQESQEESGSEGLPSPPVVDNTLPLSCILQCPVPQLTGFHLGFPPGLAWSPWTNQTFTTLPLDSSRDVLLRDSGIMACSGILEPSSDDYMPVKKVQG